MKYVLKMKIDDEGNRWTKVYFGGGEHFKGWLAQCKELGEVLIEEVDSSGYKCFEEAGEKLYRIWVKMDTTKGDDPFYLNLKKKQVNQEKGADLPERRPPPFMSP